jgi:hypothetical protein
MKIALVVIVIAFLFATICLPIKAQVQPTYIITTAHVGNGVITPSDGVHVITDGTLKLTAIPETNYEFVCWLVNGTNIGFNYVNMTFLGALNNNTVYTAVFNYSPNTSPTPSPTPIIPMYSPVTTTTPTVSPTTTTNPTQTTNRNPTINPTQRPTNNPTPTTRPTIIPTPTVPELTTVSVIGLIVLSSMIIICIKNNRCLKAT